MEYKRNTFVFNVEWYNILRDYPSEVRLEVYDAMMEYVATGIFSELKPMAKIAFSFIKKEIDANIEKYNDTCRKRSEAGKIGNEKRWKNKNIAKVANAIFVSQKSQSIAKIADNDNDNDNKEKTISKEIVKKKATNVATLTERKESFKLSLEPYLQKYSRDMLNDFYVYWTEENQSRTKMRFELEKTWGLGNRLATWARRDNNFKQQRNGNTFKSYQQVEREHRAKQHSEFAEEILHNLVY